MTSYKTVKYGKVDVCYLDELDGGGARFGQDYLDFIPRHLGNVGHVLEWCAGPGFIGFSLLAAGVCERLTLVDVNPVAVAACRETVARNRLEDAVRIYESDCMDAVPRGHAFDLVVGNPPHCPDTTPSPGGHTQLIYNDVGWQIHRKFYRQMPAYLADEGRIILQEDASQSSADEFRRMIEAAGLEFVGTSRCVWAQENYPSRGTRLYPEYYYVDSRAVKPTELVPTSRDLAC